MIKTPAIVIKETDYRENDKMLTLFSPTFGRIDALSRGCKKPDGKLMASSQMFVCGDYQFNEKSNKFYHAGCEIAHPFFGLRESYEKLYTAYFFAEIAERFVLYEQADEKLYHLLINALFALENDLNTPEYILLFFLVKTCDAVGLRPHIAHCAACGNTADAYYFVIEEGYIVCSECAGNIKAVKRRMTKQEIEQMTYILDRPSKAIRTKQKSINSKHLTDILVTFLADKAHGRFKCYQMIAQNEQN